MYSDDKLTAEQPRMIVEEEGKHDTVLLRSVQSCVFFIFRDEVMGIVNLI